MNTDTKQLVSISEANQNFSSVAKKVDKLGSVVVLKNNVPKYVIFNLEESMYYELTPEEKIDIVVNRILKEHRYAFEELAK